MTVPAEQLEVLRVEAEILADADPAFRAKLLAEPHAALEELITSNSGGIYTLGAQLKVRAFEDTASVKHIVIPAADRVEGSSSEMAEIARAIAEDGTLREALMNSPKETLAKLVREKSEEDLALPEDVEVKAVIEEVDELTVVVGASNGEMVAHSELLPMEKLAAMATHTCFTYNCPTNIVQCQLTGPSLTTTGYLCTAGSSLNTNACKC